ncbi:MAG: DUF6089 family protein [Haliscomenobacter sp.]
MKKLAFWPLVFILGSLNAQKGWEAGVMGGVAYYFGDLNTNYYLGLPNAAGSVLARYNFNERLCFKMAAAYGHIEGDDALSKNIFERSRNLSFRSPILDGSANVEFNFLPYFHGSRTEFFTPYVFAGISVFSFNPMAYYQNKWVELRPLGTEGQFKGEEYYAVQPAFSFGGGFKMDINSEWSINIEIAARNASTDYLDDVSTVYPDMRDLGRQRGNIAVALSDRSVELPPVPGSQIGEEGSQRGNGKENDRYLFLQAGIVRYFGSLRCPDPKGRWR